MDLIDADVARLFEPSLKRNEHLIWASKPARRPFSLVSLSLVTFFDIVTDHRRRSASRWVVLLF